MVKVPSDKPITSSSGRVTQALRDAAHPAVGPSVVVKNITHFVTPEASLQTAKSILTSKLSNAKNELSKYQSVHEESAEEASKLATKLDEIQRKLSTASKESEVKQCETEALTSIHEYKRSLLDRGAGAIQQMLFGKGAGYDKTLEDAEKIISEKHDTTSRRPG